MRTLLERDHDNTKYILVGHKRWPEESDLLSVHLSSNPSHSLLCSCCPHLPLLPPTSSLYFCILSLPPLLFPLSHTLAAIYKGAPKFVHPRRKDGWMICRICVIVLRVCWGAVSVWTLHMRVGVRYDANRTSCVVALLFFFFFFWCSVQKSPHEHTQKHTFCVALSHPLLSHSCSNGFHWHQIQRFILPKQIQLMQTTWDCLEEKSCQKSLLGWCQKSSSWLNPIFALKRPFNI